MDISNLVKEKFLEYGFNLYDGQIEKFNLYYNFLIQENSKFNLTAITSPEDVVLKHFVDSCLGAQLIESGAYLCDIGTGAGFPSIPLKILRPDIKMVLVDSLNKRVGFLNELIDILGLKDIVAIHIRAEDFLNNALYRERFSCVVSRAVAQTRTLLELTTPALKIGGRAIFYKSQNFDEENFDAQNACKILGCKFCGKKDFELGENFRCLAIYEKIAQTPPKYPRGRNLPKNKPL